MELSYYKQETNYTCWCALVRMILGSLNYNIPSEKEMIKLLNTNDKIWTSPENIIKYFNNLWLEIISQFPNGSYQDAFKLYNDWYFILILHTFNVPHWALLHSYSNSHIFFNDPFRWEKFAYPKHKFIKGLWKVNHKDFSEYKSNNSFIAIKRGL